MTRVFLAWQDPVGRTWHPIGMLTFDGSVYCFEYTAGAAEAKRTAGFRELDAFPDLHATYESKAVFPFFANRILMSTRPDYDSFVSYMELQRTGTSPLELLARSGGKRVTDSYELFSSPELGKDGKYRIVFFAHGLRHFPSESVGHVAQLSPGDPLLLERDLQNKYDRHAMLLRTAGDESDRFIVGYLPRYLAGDLIDVVRSKPEEVHIQVEKINPAPAPLQLRMLCRLEASQQSGWQPFRGDRFRPMSARTSDRSPDAT